VSRKLRRIAGVQIIGLLLRLTLHSSSTSNHTQAHLKFKNPEKKTEEIQFDPIQIRSKWGSSNFKPIQFTVVPKKSRQKMRRENFPGTLLIFRCATPAMQSNHGGSRANFASREGRKGRSSAPGAAAVLKASRGPFRLYYFICIEAGPNINLRPHDLVLPLRRTAIGTGFGCRIDESASIRKDQSQHTGMARRHGRLAAAFRSATRRAADACRSRIGSVRGMRAHFSIGRIGDAQQISRLRAVQAGFSATDD